MAEYTLGKLSTKTNTPLHILKYWIEQNYLEPHAMRKLKNGVDSYVFTDKNVDDVSKVKALKKAGFSLGAAWLALERNPEAVDKLLNAL